MTEREDRRYRRQWNGRHLLGVDVGISHDFTAFTLLKVNTPNVLVPVSRYSDEPVIDKETGQELVLPEGVSFEKFMQPRYDVIDLQRILHSDFETIAREIKAVLYDVPHCHVAIDATGMGTGLVMECKRIGLRPLALTLSGGSRITGARQSWRVPSNMVYEAVHMVFAQDRYRLGSQLELTRALMNELQCCEVHRSERGHASYEVHGEIGHGDLLMSLALATVTGEDLTTPRTMRNVEFTVGGTPGRDGRPGTPIRKGGRASRVPTARRYMDAVMADIRRDWGVE